MTRHPAAPPATTADLDRAERFTGVAMRRLLRNGPVQPRWLPGGDRFWYETRGSSGAEWRLVDPVGPTVTPLEAAPEPADPAPLDGIRSPDGRLVAFLRGHDLWIRDAAGGGERPLTTDGDADRAYATDPDYARLAVVLGHERATPSIRWSPDSSRILTHRLDQRGVRSLHLVETAPAGDDPRPVLSSYRCAFPGDQAVPRAELLVIEATTGAVTPIRTEPLVARGRTQVTKGSAWWSPDGDTAWFVAEDRAHRHVRLLSADAATGETRTVLEERGETYLDLGPDRYPPSVRTLRDGTVIWYSERDGWAHFYLVDGTTGEVIRQLTSGSWRVDSILGVDENQGRLTFTARGREAGRDPYWPHLYRVALAGGEPELLTPEPAAHAVSLSPSGRYFVDVHSTVERPPVSVLRAADGTLVRELERADIGGLVAAGWRAPERFSTLAADGETRLYGNLYTPSRLDPSLRYPVVEAHYPGPQSVDAPPAFRPDDAQALAEAGFVVVRVEGRGKAGRSKAFHDFQYGERFGEAGGLVDSVATIRQLAATRPWMDTDRIGITGYSGGGWSAVRALIAFPDVYRAAAAGGGNHNQLTTIARWGERYIGLPGESEATDRGYDAGDNARHVEAIRGAVFLYHGDLDDDVPPANTLRLADALIAARKDFELLIVPGEDHEGAASSAYVKRRVWAFFVRRLQGGDAA